MAEDQNRTPEIPDEEPVKITFDGQDIGTLINEISEATRDTLTAAGAMLAAVQGHTTELLAATVPTFTALNDHWQELRDALAEVLATIPAWMLKLIDAAEDLAPYLKKELKKPKYEGKSIDVLFDTAERNADGSPTEDSLFMQALRAAREAQERAQLPAVDYTPIENQQIQLNIDNVQQFLFNPRKTEKVDKIVRKGHGAKKGEIPGQLSFIPVNYGRRGENEIMLYYSLDYDKDALKKLGLNAETTAEDFFILSVIADSLTKGNKEISPSSLYKIFAGKAPNTEQRTQFVNRLMKMASTTVDIDDREVMEEWGLETYNQYWGPLAPLKFINQRYVVNGGIVDSVIRITDFPDVLRTGREIGQYITIPKSLLYVTKRVKDEKTGKYKKDKNGKYIERAVKRTPRFYELLMYSLKEIARIKDGKRKNKILYSTVYEELGIDPKAREDNNARNDTLKTFFVILDHFKRERWITGYEQEETKSTGAVGVTIKWASTDEKSIAAKKRARAKKAKETP